MNQTPKRYVGLDVHKHYVMVGAVDRDHQLVLPPRKVSLVEFEGWAQKYLQASDEVAMEATTNAWYVHDLLEPVVGRVVVTHPPHIKLIAAAMVKTDKKDTMTLAKLLAVNLVPEVWVPPVHVRDLRAAWPGGTAWGERAYCCCWYYLRGNIHRGSYCGRC